MGLNLHRKYQRWEKYGRLNTGSFIMNNYFYCQTPNLVLGLGVDFTFLYNNKNNKNNNNNKKNNKNPHLIFHTREDTRGLTGVSGVRGLKGEGSQGRGVSRVRGLKSEGSQM